MPLAVIGGLLGVNVASELAADKSGLLTELGGVELSAETVSSVLVDLLPWRESIELLELSGLSLELFFDFRLVCECEMRRHAFDSEGIVERGGCVAAAAVGQQKPSN